MTENKTLTTKTNNTNINTLAHEMIARDEQTVGVFFAALAIQYFFHKDMLSNKLVNPTFLKIFQDMETFATQRMFIKNLIGNKKYVKILEEIQSIYLEFCSDSTKNPHPYLIFLSRINKAFLIRQIFNHTNQILEKYTFLEDFLFQEQVDLEKLNNKIWHFPVEQQILILARIYSTINDKFEDKKKTIMNSYKENLQRSLEELSKNPSRYQQIQINNLKVLENSNI